MYTTKQFIADATKEAKLLRKHATEEELQRLSIDKLDAVDLTKCVYGQMTGSCFSKRAAQLIQLCTPRYFTDAAISGNNENSILDIASAANGKVVEGFIEDRVNRTIFSEAHYSSLEAYISWEDAKNDNLIAYLRGETNDPNL